MRFGILAVLVMAVTTVFGRQAEAQARGTLQASATVVDTRQSFEALALVREAVRPASKLESTNAVATVAQVSSTRSTTRPGTLVVTVDYSRN